jgi:hypothetical protein
MINRLKLRAVGLILAIFVAGGLLGTVVATTWSDTEPGNRRGERTRASYADRLAAELELSPEQRESVAVILARRNQAMQDIWAEMRPAFDSLRSQIRAEINANLTADQQVTFAALVQASDSARATRARDAEARRDRP